MGYLEYYKNNVLIYLNTNKTATEIKKNVTYLFACIIYSDPCVNLTLYDTDSMTPLSRNTILYNDFTSINNNNISINNTYMFYSYDWLNKICFSEIAVFFQLKDNDKTFDNTRSITCAASSLTPRVNLTGSTNANVIVIKSTSKI